MSAQEFLRWYWLKNELADFARRLGVRATGGKQLLTERISATLSGRVDVEPEADSATRAAQLSAPLTAETVIPRGQRCSQVVRMWLTERVGPGFRFDAEMRAFFASGDGTRTMGDALAHWHRTRKHPYRTIDAQFEYNRFTRAWHTRHPEGTREQLLDAWRDYRSHPVDVRGRV